MRLNRGLLYSLLSVILMALAGPLYKFGTLGSSVEAITFYACLAALTGSAIFIAFNFPIKFERNIFRSALVLSVLYTTAMLGFSFASKNENPGIVSILSRTNIVFSFLISFLVFKEKFNFKKAVGILLIIAGTLFLVSTNAGIEITLGLSLVLYYALAFSIHNAILKNIQNSNFPFVLFFQNLVACISIFLFSSDKEQYFQISTSSLGFALSAGFLSSFLGFIFYQSGLRLSSFSEATSVRSLSPVIALAVAYPFFPIIFDHSKIIGTFLIFSGVAIFFLWQTLSPIKPRIEGYYKFSDEKRVASEILKGRLKEKYGSILDVGCGDGTLSQYLAQRTVNLHLCEISPFYESKLRSHFPNAHLEIADIWKVQLKKYDLIHFSQGLYYHETKRWVELIEHLMSSLETEGELLLVMNDDTGDWWKAVNSVWSQQPQSLKFHYQPMSEFISTLKNTYVVSESKFEYDVKFPDENARNRFIREACVPIRPNEQTAQMFLDQYIKALPPEMLTLNYRSNFISIKR